jgi:cytoskeleton protein RodZ
MPEIGATLREARMRARIDISEIEAKTKIRAKYLRALENEEWDLLPGPTFVKSFLRTYGEALELDGRALVEEYKLSYEPPGEAERLEIDRSRGERSRRGPSQSGATARRGRSRGSNAPPRQGPPRAYIAAVAGVCLLIVLLLIGLLTGGSSPKHKPGAPAANLAGRPPHHNHPHAAKTGAHRQEATSKAGFASLQLEPTGEIYVCLIGDSESKRIPGLILKPGAAAPVYHARRFLLTLGNDAVHMTVNGSPYTVPPSSQAIGYEITPSGVHTLAASQEPTCT